MANLTKIYVLFKTSFWLEEGFSGEVVSNGGPSLVESCEKGPVVIFFDATTRFGTPALVGFIGGKAADQWNSKVSFQMGFGILAWVEIMPRVAFLLLSLCIFTRFFRILTIHFVKVEELSRENAGA